MILKYTSCLILLSLFYNVNIQSTPIQKKNANAPMEITIASEPDYPPFCIVNKEGKADGFSIDLFMAVAKAVNIDVDIKIGIWNKIKQDLADGKIDALPLVGKTPERENIFDFTLPYLTLHGAIFVRKGEENKITSINSLKNLNILVMKGDNAEEYIIRNQLTEQIITTNTFKEAFRKLSIGEGDALIIQRVIGLYLLKEMNLKSIVPLDIPLFDFHQDFCFAVKKGNTNLLSRLNEGLYIVITSNEYDEIHQKWFGPSTSTEIIYKKVTEIIITIIIPIIAFLAIIAVWLLRFEVRRKTRRILNEIIAHKETIELLHNQQSLLREMEREANVGGWEYDVINKKITWTEGVYEIYGVKREEFKELSKDIGVSYYHPEEKKIIDNAFTQALEQGKPYNLEIRFISADGKAKWVRTSGKAQYIDGKIVRVYGIIIDITQQKTIENELLKIKNALENIIGERTKELEDKIQKLNKSQKAMLYMVEDLNITTNQLKDKRKELEFAIKELEAFAYSVSHDLRAPLRAIDGFSNMILEKYYTQLDDDGKRLFNVIRSNTQKMANLIEDLLMLSRVSRSELSKQYIDMTNMVYSIYYELTNEVQRGKIIFDLQPLPPTYGDTVLLRQVWANLLSNAIKFSSKSEQPQIIVNGEINSNETIYSIKDNGVGYNPQYAHKLFCVFQRLHREDQFHGTGVGLAIVQRIINRHGGKVWSNSELGKGATFCFSLPLIVENKKEVEDYKEL